MGRSSSKEVKPVVKCVTATIKNGVLHGKWRSRSSGNFDVIIKENGEQNEPCVVTKKSISWKCKPASKYELLVSLVGESEYISSNTVYSEPSMVGNATAKKKNGGIEVTWDDSKNQDVQYYLQAFKDGEPSAVVYQKSKDNIYVTKIVSPSSKYKFKIWARSIQGNIDGKTTSVEIIDEELEVYYNVTVVPTVSGNAVHVIYFLKDRGERNRETQSVSLPPKSEYKTTIEGNVVTHPSYLVLRHKDVRENGIVEHTFILEEKPPGRVILTHVIPIRINVNKSFAFEWKEPTPGIHHSPHCLESSSRGEASPTPSSELNKITNVNANIAIVEGQADHVSANENNVSVEEVTS